MNGWISRLEHLSERLERVARWMAGSLLLVMLVCITIQIVARYVFAQPPAWTEEVARHAMIWAGLLGAAIACRQRLDPVLSNATNWSSGRLRALSQGIEAIAILIFTIPLLLATPRFLELHAERFTDSLRIPSVYVVLIIPVCFTLITFQVVVRLLAEWRDRTGPNSNP